MKMKLTTRKIRRLERKIFPNLKFEDKIYCSDPKDTETNWVFFTPSFYFKEPALITSDIIEHMQGNANLLSVGSGPAYLEQFLTLAYNIPKENITLSDIKNKFMPNGYEFIQFDLKESWPNLKKTFDYIIFPESLFFGTAVDSIKSQTYEDKTILFNHILSECSNVMNLEGEVRMKGTIPLQNIVTESVKKQNAFQVIKCVYKPPFESYIQLKKVHIY